MSKVVCVTGAARGIGKAVALYFANKGYDVVVNYLGSEARALQVKASIEALGQRCLVIQADVTDTVAVNNMVETIIQQFGRIDVLVNNSGITKDKVLLRMSEDDFKSVLDTNLIGTFNCTKAVGKVMMKQRSGSIINMSSVVGLIGNIGQANYAASKAGVIGFTKAVAKELAGYKVRVNAVAPGFIETEMTEKLPEQLKAAMINTILLKRLGQPEDVAKCAYFLAGEDSEYITGQVINVDGGMVV